MSATEKECKHYTCKSIGHNQALPEPNGVKFTWTCEEGVKINYNSQIQPPFSITENGKKRALGVQRIGLKYRGIDNNSTVLETDSSFIEVHGTSSLEMTWCAEMVSLNKFAAINEDEMNDILAKIAEEAEGVQFRPPSVTISLRLR